MEAHLFTVEELHYNMQIMQETLDRGIAVDAGFLEIFRNGANELALSRRESRSIKSKIVNLNTYLNQVSRPVIEKAVSAEEFAERFSSEKIQKGIRLLGCRSIRKIRGDGHCLFRAFASGLLEVHRNASKQQRRKLRRIFLKLSNPEIVQIVTGLLDKKKGIEQVLEDSYASGRLVELMRNLAVKEIETHSDLYSHFIDDQSVEDYCKRMQSMKLATYGGELELAVLAKIFHTNIQVHNATSKNHFVSCGIKNAPKVHLLYTDIHYDLIAQ